MLDKHCLRIGQPVTSKDWPIKLIMNSEGDKDNITTNLKKLKNADKCFKTIQVTDDHTIEERELQTTTQSRRENYRRPHNRGERITDDHTIEERELQTTTQSRRENNRRPHNRGERIDKGMGFKIKRPMKKKVKIRDMLIK